MQKTANKTMALIFVFRGDVKIKCMLVINRASNNVTQVFRILALINAYYGCWRRNTSQLLYVRLLHYNDTWSATGKKNRLQEKLKMQRIDTVYSKTFEGGNFCGYSKKLAFVEKYSQ